MILYKDMSISQSETNEFCCCYFPFKCYCGLKSINSNLRNNISVVYNRKKFGMLWVITIHFIFVPLRTIAIIHYTS